MPPSRTPSSTPTEIIWTLPSTPGQADNGFGFGNTGTKHTKKKPASHIPRPPNAFILFRSSFIKSQHVSTDVETNHSTLSKIIGMTWQGMKEEERKIWHDKAKTALEEHRRRFPAYAFRPTGGGTRGGNIQDSDGGGGAKRRKVREVEPKDNERCQKIAELLVEGLKGTALDAAIREFDKTHVKQIITRFEAPITESAFRDKDVRKTTREAVKVNINVDIKKEAEMTSDEMVDHQMYYPEAGDAYYCHTPTSPYPTSPVPSYPTSPVDTSSPMANNFFNPEFIDSSCQPPAPSYDTLSPPSYQQDAAITVTSFDPVAQLTSETPLDSFFGSGSDMFTFEFPGAADGNFLTEFMDFEMPLPLNPTWNISGGDRAISF